MEAEYIDFRQQVELTADSSSKKEIRMLKTVIKNLEEELATSRLKHQRLANKRNQQYRQLVEEVTVLANYHICVVTWTRHLQYRPAYGNDITHDVI